MASRGQWIVSDHPELFSTTRSPSDHPPHQTSDLCLNTVISVFRADNTGEPSLEIVRLLNRMIKERKYNVHPEVLSCLLHLRLKTELGVRASETKADKESVAAGGKTFSKGRAAARRAKGKTVDQPHLSKKEKTMLKDRKEIEHEMHEAAAEVNDEERATRVSGPNVPFPPGSMHPSERLRRRDGIFAPRPLPRRRTIGLTTTLANLICIVLAHRNSEAAVRVVLQRAQKSEADTSAPRGAARDRTFRAPREHRFFQGPVAGFEDPHDAGPKRPYCRHKYGNN